MNFRNCEASLAAITYCTTNVQPFQTELVTEKKYSGGEGHILKFSLSWGLTASVIFKLLFSKIL